MLYGALKVVIGTLLRIFFRIEVDGADNVPATGGAILASNHQAFCDSLFLPASTKRRVTFVAKAEYFQQRRTAWFFRAVGQIPMHRGGGEKSEQSLGEALDLLRDGGVLGIYPEGTRPPDERLYRGRTGVARLALAAGCPVVPVALIGTRDVQPVGARFLRPFKTVKIRFGKPIDFAARYGERAEDPMVLRQITDELMFEIRELSGQSYVDKYASRSAPVQASVVASNGLANGSVPAGAVAAGNGAAASPTTAGMRSAG
ncbi:MAG TPA: lysophospholipid acyltransferase family protein [Acidimicrobiales bacterium]|nr:lysophospholipid acyltransferase family protein [Acidimicrobiales bacterium]